MSVHRSLWLREALAAEEGSAYPEQFDGTNSVDVCIVGGGFTGLWTAIRITEVDASVSVAVVEADICGSGASGRNGGFVMSWWSKFGSLVKACGVDEATRLATASATGIVEIGEFCRAHGVDAQYHHRGWLWTATSQAQVGAWEDTLGKLQQQGLEPFERLEPSEVGRCSGSSTHLAGVFEPTAAIVHPGYLVRGLRRVALERGVKIFEHSPMTGLGRSGGRRQVHTKNGTISADRVVLAINAWAAPLREYRPFLIVVASDVIATPAIPDRLRSIGWEPGLAVSDSRRLVNYYRTTDDGRVVFGKGGGTHAFRGQVGDAFNGRSPREAEVLAHFHRTYPSLNEVGLDHSWRGPIDYAASGVPSFLSVGESGDTFCAAGYSGNGVGPSYIGGRILASLALGLDDEWASCGLTQAPNARLPGEPFRYVGGRVVQRAIAQKERQEDVGSRPGWATTQLARLDPTGFVEATQSPARL
jgi:glycine/D-amino acid oxidase-like deaminating enzyme